MCSRRPWHKWTAWQATEAEHSSPLFQLLSKGTVGAPEIVHARVRCCTRCLKQDLRLVNR